MENKENATMEQKKVELVIKKVKKIITALKKLLKVQLHWQCH